MNRKWRTLYCYEDLAEYVGYVYGQPFAIRTECMRARTAMVRAR